MDDLHASPSTSLIALYINHFHQLDSAQTKPFVNNNKMGKRVTILLLALILGYGATMAKGFKGEKEESSEGSEQEKWFLLPNSEPVMKTNAGEMRVVKSHLGSSLIDKPLHIGFIQMAPETLFLPLYLDSSLILFVRNGEPTVGFVYKMHMVERQLKVGDVFRIPAGSTFYILNTAEDQRLHIICGIDPSHGLNSDTFQAFFIGGGTYPTSILAGFGPETLSTAFNVSESKVSTMLNKQHEGPIVYLKGSHGPSIWNPFSLLDPQDRLEHVKRIVQVKGQAEEEKEWSLSYLFDTIVGIFEENDLNRKAPKPYNLYEEERSFKNNYGWAVGIDESEYKPLKDTGIGIYLVNLTSGSMLAPRFNPRATDYGIVLRGSGRIQIVYPNGTIALDAKVEQGDMFWVPRYYAFCQTASASEPFEFLGFMTASQKNHPQFLVGANSLLHTLNSLELADAFGVSKAKIRHFINAQHESVILPSPSSPSLSSYYDENEVSAF